MTDATAQSLTTMFRIVTDNDSALVKQRRELVAAAILDDNPRATLRDSLREWTDDLCRTEELAGTLAGDLLRVALDGIDWYQLTIALIEEQYA